MSSRRSDDTRSLVARDHPDRHEVDDWFLYGPKDTRIAELVNDLVIQHGMRVADVESLILIALQNKKDAFLNFNGP